MIHINFLVNNHDIVIGKLNAEEVPFQLDDAYREQAHSFWLNYKT